jgi:TRAP transporter TAXI family solute receptor
VNVTIEAFLACANLSWDDVIRVDFPGYNAMWNGVLNGQIDVAYANTVSGPTRKLEASPRGIFWPEVRHADTGCWQRIRAKVPFMTKHFATRGAGISATAPHEGATYPYPLLIALADSDPELAYTMTRVLHQHYDEYKDADPGGIGWALDRQIFDWVVPFHRGAVRYLREVGVWNKALDSHNAALITRQAVLQQAWTRYRATPAAQSAPDKATFANGWLAARIVALDAQGLDPIWR